MAAQLPHWRRAHWRGLALWVSGTLLAQRACPKAVMTALLTRGGWHTGRQRWRAWLYDGADKAAPGRTQGEGTACCAPLLRWVRVWWQGASVALAWDATAPGVVVGALVLRVWYRRHAIPGAWAIRPAHQPGAGMPARLALVPARQPAVPPARTVRLRADRGLWRPRRWGQWPQGGWHPVGRLQHTTSWRG